MCDYGYGTPRQKQCTSASWDSFQSCSIGTLVQHLSGHNGHGCMRLLSVKIQDDRGDIDIYNRRGSQDHKEVVVIQEDLQSLEGWTSWETQVGQLLVCFLQQWGLRHVWMSP